MGMAFLNMEVGSSRCFWIFSRCQALRIFDSMILNSARIYVQHTDTNEPQRKVQ